MKHSHFSSTVNMLKENHTQNVQQNSFDTILRKIRNTINVMISTSIAIATYRTAVIKRILLLCVIYVFFPHCGCFDCSVECLNMQKACSILLWIMVVIKFIRIQKNSENLFCMEYVKIIYGINAPLMDENLLL